MIEGDAPLDDGLSTWDDRGVPPWTTPSASRPMAPAASGSTTPPLHHPVCLHLNYRSTMNTDPRPVSLKELLVAGLYCEGTFDSWLCWPHTAADTVAYARCPDFVPGFSADCKWADLDRIGAPTVVILRSDDTGMFVRLLQCSRTRSAPQTGRGGGTRPPGVPGLTTLPASSPRMSVSA